MFVFSVAAAVCCETMLVLLMCRLSGARNVSFFAALSLSISAVVFSLIFGFVFTSQLVFDLVSVVFLSIATFFILRVGVIRAILLAVVLTLFEELVLRFFSH